MEGLKPTVTSWEVAEQEPRKSKLELTPRPGEPASRSSSGEGLNGLEGKVTVHAVSGH